MAMPRHLPFLRAGMAGCTRRSTSRPLPQTISRANGRSRTCRIPPAPGPPIGRRAAFIFPLPSRRRRITSLGSPSDTHISDRQLLEQQRAMKDSAVETAIGAIVIAIADVFLVFVYNTTDRASARSGYRIVAEFDNVGAVNVGTDVRLAGIKVGSVVAQELDPQTFQARVTMLIDPRLKLTDYSTAKVSSEGILGQPFISLEPGGSETVLADGGELQFTQGAIDIWKLVSEAMFSKSNSETTTPQPSADKTEAPAAPEASQPSANGEPAQDAQP